MIYTKDAAGFELNIGDTVMCVKRVYHDDIGLNRPSLIKATVDNICPKTVIVTDGKIWFRAYPD